MEERLKAALKNGTLAKELVRLGFWPESFLLLPNGWGFANDNEYLDLVHKDTNHPYVCYSPSKLEFSDFVTVDVYLKDNKASCTLSKGNETGTDIQGIQFWDALCMLTDSAVEELVNKDAGEEAEEGV